MKLKYFVLQSTPLMKEKDGSNAGKIVVKLISHEGLVSRICKELQLFSNKEKNNPSKQAKDLNRPFTKENI